MTNRIYKQTKKKQPSALPVAARQMSGPGERQQQQPANHSSDNAETARYLITLSHPS